MSTGTAPAVVPGPPDPPGQAATGDQPAKGFLASMVAAVEPARPTTGATAGHGDSQPGSATDGALDRSAPGLTSAAFRDAADKAAKGSDHAGARHKRSVWKEMLLAAATRWAKGGGTANKRLDLKKAKAQAHQVKESRTTTVTKSGGLPIRNTGGSGAGSKDAPSKGSRDSSGKGPVNSSGNRSNGGGQGGAGGGRLGGGRGAGGTDSNGSHGSHGQGGKGPTAGGKGGGGSHHAGSGTSGAGGGTTPIRNSAGGKKGDAPATGGKDSGKGNGQHTGAGNGAAPGTGTGGPAGKGAGAGTGGSGKTGPNGKDGASGKTGSPGAPAPGTGHKPNGNKTPNGPHPTRSDPRTPLQKSRETGHGDGSAVRNVIDHVKAYKDGAVDGYHDKKAENAKEHDRLDKEHARHTPKPGQQQQDGARKDPAQREPLKATSQGHTVVIEDDHRPMEDPFMGSATPIQAQGINTDTITLGTGFIKSSVKRSELRTFKQYEGRLEGRIDGLAKVADATKSLTTQAREQADDCLKLLEQAKSVKGGHKLAGELQKLADKAKAQADEADEVHTRASKAHDFAKAVLSNVQTRYTPLYQAVVDSDETKPAELKFYTDRGVTPTDTRLAA
ncbi:hypothetical protein [Streptomyces glaucescens]|uniref:hypothetical protein n=1 Tax=Streptomyces glaucescens TaxID=1907 RepID=UPI001B802058|nr:hypothetical protein [Streptomyces glaucescens]